MCITVYLKTKLIFPEVEVNSRNIFYCAVTWRGGYFSLGNDTDGNNYCFSI